MSAARHSSPPPLVVLDGREFLPGRQTGIGRYLASLIARAQRGSLGWRLEVVGPPGLAPPAGVEARQIGRRDSPWWDWVTLPRHLRAAGAAAWVTPYLKYRPRAGYPVIVVLCDPADVLPPRGLPAPLGRTLRRALARRAAARIAISAWSRDAIARALDLPAETIQVIPPGVAPPAAGARSADAAGYVLHLSNGKPHKNVERLLDAYAALPAALQERHALVVAGLRPDRRAILEQAVRERAFAGQVRLAGHVDDAALPALYAGAAVFAFPSLTEGFGIPALEAMAQGVPVVASTAGALPEVLADAAVLVEPHDTGALARALATTLVDRALRERLARAGRARAAEFPVERTGAALAAAVSAVIARAGES